MSASEDTEDGTGRIHVESNPLNGATVHLFLRDDEVVLSEQSVSEGGLNRENAWFRADAALLADVER